MKWQGWKRGGNQKRADAATASMTQYNSHHRDGDHLDDDASSARLPSLFGKRKRDEYSSRSVIDNQFPEKEKSSKPIAPDDVIDLTEDTPPSSPESSTTQRPSEGNSAPNAAAAAAAAAGTSFSSKSKIPPSVPSSSFGRLKNPPPDVPASSNVAISSPPNKKPRVSNSSASAAAPAAASQQQQHGSTKQRSQGVATSSLPKNKASASRASPATASRQQQQQQQQRHQGKKTFGMKYLSETDVLFGVKYNKLPGNKRFRELCRTANAENPSSSTREIAEKVIRAVAPGRFLEKNKETGEYEEVVAEERLISKASATIDTIRRDEYFNVPSKTNEAGGNDTMMLSAAERVKTAAAQRNLQQPRCKNPNAIKQPSPTDVLFGVGTVHQLPGNRRFHELCRKICAQNPSIENLEIAEKVIRAVQLRNNPPGRFLEKDESDQYVKVDDEERVIQKVLNVISGIRRKANKEPSSDSNEAIDGDTMMLSAAERVKTAAGQRNLQQSQDKNTNGIKRLSPTDVLFGGGPNVYNLPGNRRFHELCRKVYAQDPSIENLEIAEKVIRAVQLQNNPPGRFLEKDECDQYVKVDDEERVIQKVLNAIFGIRRKANKERSNNSNEAIDDNTTMMLSAAERVKVRNRTPNGIEQPSPTDVVFGGGPNVYNLPGNQRFHELCRKIYAQDPSIENLEITEKVVRAVQLQNNPPGRFLEKDKSDQFVKVDDEERVIQKVLNVISGIRRNANKERSNSSIEAVDDVTMTLSAAERVKVAATQRNPQLSQDKNAQEMNGGIKCVSATDVVFGAGAAFWMLAGNQRFRELCQKACTGSNCYSQEIAQTVIRGVRQANPPGRFLEKNKETESYVEVEDEKRVVRKVFRVFLNIRETNRESSQDEETSSTMKGISENDVVLGQSPTLLMLPGNKQFSELCRKTYAEAPLESSKAEIAQAVVRAVKELKPPGRFFQCNDDGTYMEAEDEKAVQKAYIFITRPSFAQSCPENKEPVVYSGVSAEPAKTSVAQASRQSQDSKTQEELGGIKDLSVNDVLFGQGPGIFNLAGNKRFWELCRAKYTEDPSSKSQEIVQKVIHAVRQRQNNPPGRFMEKNAETGQYAEVVDEQRVYRVVLDCIMGIRRNSDALSKGGTTSTSNKLRGAPVETVMNTILPSPRPSLDQKAPNHVSGGIIKNITATDVLCDKGAHNSNFAGNLRLLLLCRKSYVEAPTGSSSMEIARTTVDAVKGLKPPGRFLQSNGDGAYMEVGDEKALQKALSIVARPGFAESCLGLKERTKSLVGTSKSSTSHEGATTASMTQQPTSKKTGESEREPKRPRGIEVVSLTDVVFGGNRRLSDLPGNKRFRELCRAAYSEAKLGSKCIEIARRAVRAVREQRPPGHFLDRNDDGPLVEVGDERAVQKVVVYIRKLESNDPSIRNEPPAFTGGPLLASHQESKAPQQLQVKSAPQNSSSIMIFSPTDVLFGIKGRQIHCKFPGNVRFRNLCQEAYEASPATPTREIALQVLRAVREQSSPPGRFLERRDGTESYMEVDGERTIQKTMQVIWDMKRKLQSNEPATAPLAEQQVANAGEKKSVLTVEMAPVAGPWDAAKLNAGARVAVLWPLDKRYYEAIIIDRKADLHMLEYTDDGEIEWLDLASHAFKVLSW